MALSCRPAGLRLSVERRTVARTLCRPSRIQVVRVQALFGGGGGGGGGGSPFDMMGMMERVKKAQQLVQVETVRIQKELSETEFEGYDEDETVRVVVSGNQEPRSVDVTQEAIDCGPEKLSLRVTAAMKDAHSKSTTAMKEKMKGLAKSLGIPGMPGM